MVVSGQEYCGSGRGGSSGSSGFGGYCTLGVPCVAMDLASMTGFRTTRCFPLLLVLEILFFVVVDHFCLDRWCQ